MNTLVLRNYPYVIRGLKTDCWTLSSRFLGNTEQTSCELTAQGQSGSLAWRSPAHIPSRHVWTPTAPPSTCAHPVTRMDARGTSKCPVPTCVEHAAQMGPCGVGVHTTQASLPCAQAAWAVWMALDLQRDFPGTHTLMPFRLFLFAGGATEVAGFFYKLVVTGLFEISLSSGVSIHRLYFRRKMIHLIQVFTLNRVAT